MRAYDLVRYPVQQRWKMEAWYHHDPSKYHDSVDEYYMRLAIELLSPLYMCNRPPGPAGAVLVTKTYAIFGYVGPASQTDPNCLEVGCEMEGGHCIRNIHAERRCLYIAAKVGIAIQPEAADKQTHRATMYSILKPCYECTKAIIAAGVQKVFYAGAAYDAPNTRSVLENAGIPATYIDVGLGYGVKIKKKGGD